MKRKKIHKICVKIVQKFITDKKKSYIVVLLV